MPKQFNLSELHSNAIQIGKHLNFYRVFGRNRPIKPINGSDETIDRESLPLRRGHWITVKPHQRAL